MLDAVDLSKTLDPEAFRRAVKKHRKQWKALSRQAAAQERPLIILLEGWDGAGKGEIIRRVTEKLSPRNYDVYVTDEPSGDAAQRHYLWRFWRMLPEAGRIAIFDRGWYDRILHARVEKLCDEETWKRSYREINQFERQLIDFGTLVCKFWIHISPEEQMRRFQLKQEDPYRRWKLGKEEWHNHDRWALYLEAVNDMLLRTSSLNAPWTVVEGDSNHYAQVKVLQTLIERLEKGLDDSSPDPAHYPFPERHTGKKKKKKKRKKTKNA